MSVPLVSIGMPLFNEAKYLREALESLLNQDYQHTEILLSDNASEDETSCICEEYANRDSRISVVRHQENIGAQKNFSDLVHRAKGKYFFWAGGHDLWHPSFISRCVSVLEEDPLLALAYPQTVKMDDKGENQEVVPCRIDTRGMDAAKRYAHFVWHIDCNLVYGIWRREFLKRSGLFQDVYGPDVLLLSEMALKGAYAGVDEPLWFRRYQRGAETKDEKKERIVQDLDPHATLQKQKASLVQHYRALRGKHFSLIRKTNFSSLERWKLYTHTWLAFAVRCDVFPGAPMVKSTVTRILPHSLQKKFTLWLREGKKV